MISSAEVQAESSTLDEVDVINLVSVIRTSERYKANPGFYMELKDKIEAFEGTTEAKLINAIITKLEALGIGVVEINQAQTVGTDGVVYSKQKERDALVDLLLNVMYEGIYATSVETDESILILRGNYGVGRLPLDYEGYL
jgi:hypothetical protein